jgi:hypothetical protein
VLKREDVYRPLHRNGSSSIVVCVLVAATMCLATRRLAIDHIASQYDEIFGRIIVTVPVSPTTDFPFTEVYVVLMV